MIASRRKVMRPGRTHGDFQLHLLGFILVTLFSVLFFFIDIKHFTIKMESKRTLLIKVGVMGEVRTQRSMTHFL